LFVGEGLKMLLNNSVGGLFDSNLTHKISVFRLRS